MKTHLIYRGEKITTFDLSEIIQGRRRWSEIECWEKIIHQSVFLCPILQQ